jgi:preprotein translocase subunit SecF
MIRFFADAAYDFIGYRRWAYALTGVFVVPGLVLLLVRGLNYSIEFTGGTLVQVRTATPVGTAAIRTALATVGLGGAEIQTFGSDVEYVVRARIVTEAGEGGGSTQAVRAAVDRGLEAGLGAGTYEIVRAEAVSPRVGRELQGKAALALLLSFVVTLVYLAVRFEWRFGLAAVLATAHDIFATLAFLAYLDLEVSLTVVAAVLTVVGYSLNDTIIIFDRVRENLRKYRRQNLYEILNLSVNQTLPRSILTHGTTIAAVLALALLAGPVIRPFALVMLFGVFTGTFSSIYIASPVLLLIERRWPGEDARGARLLGSKAPEPAPLPSRAPQAASRPLGR